MDEKERQMEKCGSTGISFFLLLLLCHLYPPLFSPASDCPCGHGRIFFSSPWVFCLLSGIGKKLMGENYQPKLD